MTILTTRTPSRRASEAGFTLIELLIVMSVILILMMFAIPQGLKMKKNANELSAKQSLSTIMKGEMSYNDSYKTYACTLASLGGDPSAGAPTAEASQLIPLDLASGGKAGYTFNIICKDKVTINNQDRFASFEVTAVPQSVGHSGDSGYCADDNNQIRSDPSGGTNCSQLVQ